MKNLLDFLKTLVAPPKIILQWLAIYGVKEMPGAGNNPVILGWLRELGANFAWIKDDATAWCSTASAIVALRAGKDISMVTASARSWINFGTHVEKQDAILGDMLVFSRGAKLGHIGTYCAEDKTNYYILGGNQGDQVSIIKIAKSRLIAVRRPVYSVAMPEVCKKYFMTAAGKPSENEA